MSIATVSRVLNGYPFVSDAVRRRVLDAVDALGYRPHASARSMRSGRSRAVGFVVSDISNPLFALIARGAESVLHPEGYSLVLANSDNEPSREAEAIAALHERRVDGLVIAVANERVSGLARELELFPATVLVDREVKGSRADAVLSDHAAGMDAALDHLESLGHRRIALIAGSQRQRGGRARHAAFRAAHERLGLDLDPDLVRSGEHSRETGYAAARDLLTGDAPPTAAIAGNNQIVTGFLAVVRDLGLRIPGDVSLVACDDIDLTRLNDPPIDVIERDPLELGRAAARSVLARLSEPAAPPCRVVLPTTFVVRGSTAAPARPGALAR